MVGKVAVLGDADFVMPFSTLGVDTYPVGDTTDQIIENANKIISEKYALVVIAENIAPVVEEAFAALTNAPTSSASGNSTSSAKSSSCTVTLPQSRYTRKPPASAPASP
jgi:hypothetical protein